MSISALIIAQNEEKKIEQTFKSLGFVDEIIIFDSFSTDNTINIAKSHGYNKIAVITAAGTVGDLAGTITTAGAMTVAAGGAGTVAVGQFVNELTIN